MSDKIYSSIIDNSYDSTISGLIKRIYDAHKVINTKARELGLSIPAGTKLTAAYGLSNPVLLLDTEHHKILDTAAAIDAILLQNPGNLIINASLTYTVPVGYVSQSYTISAKSLADQLSGATAEAKHIYQGKKAFGNNAEFIGGNTGGTLSKVYLYYKSGTDKSYSNNKVSNGNLKVSINAPSGNNYSTAETLETNIPYRATVNSGSMYNLEISSYNKTEGSNTVSYLRLIPTEGYYDSYWDTAIKYQPVTGADLTIDKSTAEDGTDTFEVNAVTIPAGYYANPVVVKPILHTIEGSNPDRIINYYDKALSPSINVQNGTLSNFLGGKAFDYISPSSTFSVRSADNFTLSITNASSINASIGTANGGYYPISATVEGKITATTEGWFKDSGNKSATAVIGRIALVKLGSTGKASPATAGETITTVRSELTIYNASGGVQLKTLGIRMSTSTLGIMDPTQDVFITDIVYRPTPTAPTFAVSGSKYKGTVTIPQGYYNGGSFDIEIGLGSHQLSSISSSTTTTKITTLFVRDVISAGYLQASLTEYRVQDGTLGNFVVPTAKSGSNYNFGISITGSGWLNKDTGKTLSLPAVTESTTNITDIELTITPGLVDKYIPANSYTLKGVKIASIKSSVQSDAIYNTTAASGVTYNSTNDNLKAVNTLESYLHITEGYTNVKEWKFTVKSGSHSLNSTADSKFGLGSNPTTNKIEHLYIKDTRVEGWISGGTTYYRVDDAKTFTLSISDKPGTDIILGTLSGGYYPLKTSLEGALTAATPGWFKSGSAVDGEAIVGRIAKAVLNTAVQSNSNSNGVVKNGTSVTVTVTTPGYLPSDDLTINIPAAVLNFTLSAANLTDEDSVYEIEAANGTFMTKLIFNNHIIVDELMKI